MGKLQGSNSKFRVGGRDPDFSGRYVRFGKPSSQMGERRVQPFTGWVDEIALWNRPLTHAEVHHQYQSARGK